MDYIDIDIIIPRLSYSTNFSLSSVLTPELSHPIHIIPLVNDAFTKM